MNALNRSLTTLALVTSSLALSSLALAQNLERAERLSPHVSLRDPLDRDCSQEISGLFRARHSVPVTVTTVRSDNRFATYTEGHLRFDGSRLVGEVGTAFSDRFANDGCVDGGFCFPNQRFAEGHEDSWRLWIAQDGTVTIDNLTWGGTTSLQGHCTMGGMIYGFLGTNSLVTISFGVSQEDPR